MYFLTNMRRVGFFVFFALVLSGPVSNSMADMAIGDNPTEYQPVADPRQINDLNRQYASGAMTFNEYQTRMSKLAHNAHSIVVQNEGITPNSRAIPLAGRLRTEGPGLSGRKSIWLGEKAKTLMNTQDRADGLSIQDRLDSSSCKGLSAQQILNGANTSSDRQLVSQAVSKLDQWFPGWSSQRLQQYVTLIVTDNISFSAQACVVRTGDQSMILVRRSDLYSQQNADLGPLIQIASSMAHEANHIADASWTSSCWQNGSANGCDVIRRKDESMCLRKNAAVFRAASADPQFSSHSANLRSIANQQQFFSNQMGQTNIPYNNSFDSDKFGWIWWAYAQADRILMAQYGVDAFSQTTFISGQRTPSSGGPVKDASYAFEFALPNGQHAKFTFNLDETGNPVTFP